MRVWLLDWRGGEEMDLESGQGRAFSCVDPFDGKPLRYRMRTDGCWIVYSVGPNQLDENGEQPKGDPRKYTDPGDVIFCECEPEKERERLKMEATSK